VQAVRPFVGVGLDDYRPLDPPLTYLVPPECSAQCVYFRGGNSTDELICVVLTRDGELMRLFPIGARSAIHVQLRIVEDLLTDTRLELHVAAPLGCAGMVVIDLGMLEI
jgi:assimilatory nitrate reductase catalytic subunit